MVQVVNKEEPIVSSWLVMFKKDFRMSKSSLVILFGLIVLWLLLVVSTQTTWRGSVFLIGSLSMLVWPLMFYYPVHVLRTLRQEWQKSSHLWLHTPMSGWSLLSSKMAVGLSYFAAYLVVMYGFFSWFVNFGVEHMKLPGEAHVQPLELKSLLSNVNVPLVIAISFLGLLCFGIYMGLWAAFISSCMQAVKNRWNKLAWLLGIVIFLIPTWGFSELNRVDFIRNLLHAGTFKMYVLANNLTYMDESGQSAGLSAAQAYIPIHAGEIVFYVLVSSVLFYLTGWLIEKKVEV